MKSIGENVIMIGVKMRKKSGKERKEKEGKKEYGKNIVKEL